MNKKVLLVEKSDAIRTVGENILRQNGYEVIGISDSERALEVVDYAQPDLLIVAADLTEKSGRPFYERAQSEPTLNQVPILLLINEDEEKPALSPSSMLEKPFDPKDFMGRVQSLLGGKTSTGSGKPSNPLTQAELDDDFLDAALGLDGLDVVESEVMDKTTHKRKQNKRQAQEKMLGLDHEVDDSEMADSGKVVESLMIHDEDSSDIDRKHEQKKKTEDLTASSKLEILDDQFGIQDLNAGSSLGGQQHGDHDYNWFINEMQRDAQGKPVADDAGELSFEDPSTAVDPITPPPSSESHKAKNSQEVDKFIDEFKKEVEKFDEIDDALIPDTSTNSSKASASKMDWEDTIDNLTADKVALFTRQLAYDLAEKLALRIAAKIDPDKLLNLIKAEVIARAQQEKDKIKRQ